MRALGKQQLGLLAALGSPNRFLIVGDRREAQSLLRRGLLMAHAPATPEVPWDTYLQITPAGLRALADAFEAGRITFDRPNRKPEDE